MKGFWNQFCGWKGWKRLFPLPLWWELMLFLGCCAGLAWVFARGLELWWPSYILYAISAYSLTALCIDLPGAVRKEKRWMADHPRVAGVLKNEELKFSLGLFREQLVSFVYGIYKIITGVIIGSAWIGADGIYNLSQGLIQLFQILRRRKPGSMQEQWRSYRLCGGLILLMHLTLTGIVFQTVNWHRVSESGEIMLIATAAFAFYKFITAFVDLARDRRHAHPIDSSVRMLSLAQAIFAIFSLQAGLLHTFGTGEAWEHWMNLAVGCLVCLLTAAMGVYMIRRANREIKTLQENTHGESFL
jgi:hypothetical protein